jgi:RNA polymerase sigma-70 factor (ECF subfamily)
MEFQALQRPLKGAIFDAYGTSRQSASNTRTGKIAMEPQLSSNPALAADCELVRRAAARDEAAFRIIMGRHNQRLYRIARSILRNDSEAEDAVQEAYLHAFMNLNRFRAESSLGTWLSRITINEALGRLRKERLVVDVNREEPNRHEADMMAFPHSAAAEDPERTMAQREILKLVEQAADDLPEGFRTVLVIRVVEGMSTEETATLLDLQPETVKTRLHRARQLIRNRLDAQIGPLLMEAFPFAGRRCERLTNFVLKRLDFIH